MKVLLTKNLFPDDIKYIQDRLPNGIELIFPKGYSESELIDSVGEVDVLLGGFFSRELLKHAKKLKFAQIPWTGVDNLDFDLLGEFQTVVCNSHSNSEIVAEYAVAMMFDAAKKLTYHDRELRKGNWNRISPGVQNRVSPFSRKITNSNIGLIGFGAIGQHIYKMLQGFSCNFVSFTRSGVIPKEFRQQIKSFQITEFINEAKELDFVFLAIPLTLETKGLIREEYFNAMSDKCIFINISRGQILNPEHFYKALAENKIGGAAIDTWYNYPTATSPVVLPSVDYPFHKLDNLILSPHRAGYVDTGFPHLDDAIDNLKGAFRGEKLKNVISLNTKY